MENKLQQAKDAVAKSRGLNDWNHLIEMERSGYSGLSDKMINEVAIEYNRLCNEWISVDERLPETFTSVFVFGEGIRTVAIFDMDRKFYPDFRAIVHINVTHWMPIPQPPQK